MKKSITIKDFTSWHETHFEIVAAIVLETQKDNLSDMSKKVREIQETQGHGGLYELAKDLTDEFEELHRDTQWDGEFFDTIEAFTKDKLK